MKKTPEPLYCCARPDCCDDATWSADDLWWSENKQGWYCAYCWDDWDLLDEDKGESLREYLDSIAS